MAVFTSLWPMVLMTAARFRFSFKNPGAVIMPSTIEDKIFGKPSFYPGFAKSLRRAGILRYRASKIEEFIAEQERLSVLGRKSIGRKIA